MTVPAFGLGTGGSDLGEGFDDLLVGRRDIRAEVFDSVLSGSVDEGLKKDATKSLSLAIVNNCERCLRDIRLAEVADISSNTDSRRVWHVKGLCCPCEVILVVDSR